MMQNTYTSSIISLRTCFSFNGYSYYSNERCPSSSCSCCCSLPPNSSRLIVPINPSFLYGLRQSTLIHWPPSRRLILGSGERYCCSSPVYDLGRHCCGESYCVKQERVNGLLEKSCKEKCCVKGRNVDKIRGRMSRRYIGCSALGDAEAMLSLLADKSVEESLEVRERKKSAAKEKKIFKGHIVEGEKSRNRKYRREKVGSLYLENETEKFQLNPGRVQSMEEGNRKREEVKDFVKEEDRRLRRWESSSSYYSLSDLGDFESDTEVETKYEEFEGESLTSHGKDSKKVDHVAISGETKDSKRYIDERDHQFHSSQHEKSRVGSSAEWDCRKKSEKKLAEELAEETKSKEVFGLRQSHLSQNRESSSMKASSSKRQFNHEEQKSTSGEQKLTSGVHLHELSGSHIKTDNQASKYTKSGGSHEQLTQTNRKDAGTSTWRRSDAGTSMWRRSNEGKEGVMVVGKSFQETGSEYCNACGATMQKKNAQTNVQQDAELSEFRDDARWTVVGQGQSESRLRKKEKSSTSLQTSVKEGTKKHEQMIHVGVGQVKTGRNSQQYRETMDSHGNYVESTSRLLPQLETRMKKLEEDSTSVILRQEVKERLEGSSGEVIKETESSKVSQAGLGGSQVLSTSIEIGRQSGTEQKMHDSQTYLKSKMKSVEEVVEKHKQIEETIAQSTFRTEVQGHILPARFSGNPSGEANINQPSVTVISQTGVQQLSEGKGKNNLQISMMSPSYQFIEGSTHGEPSTNLVGNDSGRVLEVGNGSAYVHPQGRIASSSDETNVNKSMPYEESSSMDTLGSATRMEESSIQIVGEFMEKLRHEASHADTRMEKSCKLDSNSQDAEVLKGATQSDSEKTRLQKRGSRRSSGGSGTTGPSDAMWDVKDNFPQEPSEMESLEGTTSEIVVPRRTGKSLWNVVTGIFRLRWGLHSETQKSPAKSGGQSSPRESASGDTWYSENEQDEANSDSLKTEQVNIPQGPTSSDQIILQRKSTLNRKEDLEVLNMDYKIRRVEEDAPSTSGALRTGLLSEGASTGASTNWNVTQQTVQSPPSLNLSTPPARRLRRSRAFEEIEEVDQGVGLIKSTMDPEEHPGNVRQTSVSSSDVSDAEWKQGKLHRSKQVMQERFGEWEVAYRRDNEQRKVDEIFMREALVEANKAADNWEVPVGAVLVQNGKIIARGYNLVEELRDSTAHAEMICIREASNGLRTWRLSGTTLYVTLEPCPMCAGAILQARIGTVVWGAPNKLLGADGSWIRLFPEDSEGEQRPEVGDKPAAPVHPFHPKMKIRRGVLEAECAGIMQQFFQLRRKKEKKSEEPAQPSCLPVPHHPSKLLHKLHDAFHFMFCL